METRCVSIGGLGHELGIALDRENAAKHLRNSLEAVENADTVVIGSSVFRGSYSGLLKYFFDLVGVSSLANTSVFLAAAGSSERQTLMIEAHLRTLFAFFWHIPPLPVFLPQVGILVGRHFSIQRCMDVLKWRCKIWHLCLRFWLKKTESVVPLTKLRLSGRLVRR